MMISVRMASKTDLQISMDDCTQVLHRSGTMDDMPAEASHTHHPPADKFSLCVCLWLFAGEQLHVLHPTQCPTLLQHAHGQPSLGAPL